MKHIITFTLVLLAFAGYGQKQEREKITYDSTGRTLYIVREVTEAIDTAKLYARLAAVKAVIQRKQAERDTILAQIKTARKLMTGKKGGNGGNNKSKKDAQPIEQPATPQPAPEKTKTKKSKKQ